MSLTIFTTWTAYTLHLTTVAADGTYLGGGSTKTYSGSKAGLLPFATDAPSPSYWRGPINSQTLRTLTVKNTLAVPDRGGTPNDSNCGGDWTFVASGSAFAI